MASSPVGLDAGLLRSALPFLRAGVALTFAAMAGRFGVLLATGLILVLLTSRLLGLRVPIALRPRLGFTLLAACLGRGLFASALLLPGLDLGLALLLRGGHLLSFALALSRDLGLVLRVGRGPLLLALRVGCGLALLAFSARDRIALRRFTVGLSASLSAALVFRLRLGVAFRSGPLLSAITRRRGGRSPRLGLRLRLILKAVLGLTELALALTAHHLRLGLHLRRRLLGRLIGVASVGLSRAVRTIALAAALLLSTD